MNGYCTREGCTRKAELVPVLVFRARGSEVPAEGTLKQLGTCRDCAEVMGVGDVLSDEGWRQIVNHFKAMGKAMPAREKTELAWKPM